MIQNQHHPLVFLFLGWMLLLSCDKEEAVPKEEISYYHFSPKQLAHSPYFINDKYDTIGFYTNKGDTTIFAKLSYEKLYTTDSDVDMSGNRYIFKYQYLYNTYKTLKGTGTLEVSYFLKTNDFKVNAVDNFNIFKIDLFSKKIEFSPKVFDKKDPAFPFYDSIKVGGNFFNNVVLFHNTKQGAIFQYYYANEKEGIIAFFEPNQPDTIFLIKK